MESAKPSFDLGRAITDEHVLRALMRHRRLTRAELAARSGTSTPTAGESVRRLTERGVIADTGERTPGGRGRGRVGSYYALAADARTALAPRLAPRREHGAGGCGGRVRQRVRGGGVPRRAPGRAGGRRRRAARRGHRVP